MAFGYDSSRLQTSGEIAVSAVFTVDDRRAGGAARHRPRLARVPQAHAAARRAQRRLHLPEPRPGPRPRARRHPVVGRRARRSRRAQGRAGRRRAGVAAARQLHRPRRRRHGARHPRPGRALPAAAWPSASACGCAKRSSTSASSTDPVRTRPHTTMSTLLIEGGRRLSGRITVDGNKNSALPLVAACLLSDETCRLENVPRISDIRVMADLLTGAGRAGRADSARRRSRSRRRR